VPVTVPRAERFAVHKIIVAAERRDQAKSAKDSLQADILIKALATSRPIELAKAWQIAWENGPRWREKLEAGRHRLTAEGQEAIESVLAKARASKKRRRTT
jgi:hypothetical protein